MVCVGPVGGRHAAASFIVVRHDFLCSFVRATMGGGRWAAKDMPDRERRQQIILGSTLQKNIHCPFSFREAFRI